MEFQGQRGDPFSAWSVGKYAKRSATIHLNSKDIARDGADNFRSHIVTQDANGIVFDDPKGFIRGKFATEGFDGFVVADETYQSDHPLGTLALRPGDSPALANPRSPGLFGEDNEGDIFTDVTQIAQSDALLFTQSATTFPLVAPVNDYENDGNTPPKLNTTGATAAGGVDNILRDALLGTEDALRKLNTRQDHGVTVNGEVISSASLELQHNPGGDEFHAFLPLASFPAATDKQLGALHHLHVPTEEQGIDGLAELVREGNTGWRLELFYSNDYRNNVGAAKDSVDNANASTWQVLFVGTAHFNPKPKMLVEEPGVHVTLHDSPNLRLLFSNPEYASLRANVAEGGVIRIETLTFAHKIAHPNADGGASLRQINWNLRKMPSLSINAQNTFPSGQSHADYIVNIPNIIGYPEHKRCLVQLQSLSLFPTNEFSMTNLTHTTRPNEADQVCPVYVGVEVQGIGGQNMFSTAGGTLRNTQLVGTCCLEVKGHRNQIMAGSGVDIGHRVLSYGYDNSRSILDDGVLVNSPFGKSVRVRFVNLTTNQTLNTNANDDYNANRDGQSDIINNPTHLTLRLLFLDDDDLPMR